MIHLEAGIANWETALNNPTWGNAERKDKSLLRVGRGQNFLELNLRGQIESGKGHNQGKARELI